MEASLPLPTLTAQPIHHSHSCLPLSSTLITYLADVFSTTATNQPSTSASRQSQRKQIILSVGSGTGLLEVLFNQHLQRQQAATKTSLEAESDGNGMRLRVEGVEVYASPPVNKYLPDESMHIVNGTWDLCRLIKHHDADENKYGKKRVRGDVVGLMFVYPREVDLVQRYIEQITEDSESGMVRGVVWVGPRRDVEEYEAVPQKLVGDGWTREDRIGVGVGLKEWEVIVVLRHGSGRVSWRSNLNDGSGASVVLACPPASL